MPPHQTVARPSAVTAVPNVQSTAKHKLEPARTLTHLVKVSRPDRTTPWLAFWNEPKEVQPVGVADQGDHAGKVHLPRSDNTVR